MRYGYIGLGNLGAKLAGSLLRNGFDLTVSDLDRNAAEPLIAKGAKWAASPAELAASVDAVITCLPSPAVSEKVLDAILDGAKPGLVWIEMSTNDRDTILRLSAQGGRARRCDAGDARHRRRASGRDRRDHRDRRRRRRSV